MNITTRMPPSLEKENKFKLRSNEARNIPYYNKISASLQKDSLIRDSFEGNASNDNSFGGSE